MIRIDNAMFLPPADELQNVEDIKEWIGKLNNLLNNNQNDLYQDVSTRMDKSSNENINGTKTFNSLKLGSAMNCNQKQMLSMAIENRTSDQTSPTVGQIWIRTDLL
jgi:hypothetical protein